MTLNKKLISTGIVLFTLLTGGCTPAFIMEKTGLEKHVIAKRKFPIDSSANKSFPEIEKAVIKVFQNYNKKWGRSEKATPEKFYFKRNGWGIAKNSESIFKEPRYRFIFGEVAFKYTKADGARYQKFANNGWCYAFPFLIKQNYIGAATATDIHNDKYYGSMWMDTSFTERRNILCKNIN